MLDMEEGHDAVVCRDMSIYVGLLMKHSIVKKVNLMYLDIVTGSTYC